MRTKTYIRLDADNVGDSIELSLLNENLNDSQEIHNKVQEGIKLILEMLNEKKGVSVLMVGCDDVLFSINEEQFDINFLENIRKTFENKSGFTLSMGVGNTVQKALQNLRIAKISGKNKIV